MKFFLGVILVGAMSVPARADVSSVQRAVHKIDAAKMPVTTTSRSDLSAEGAEITVYGNPKAPRKITARVFGCSFQTHERLYFQDGLPLFFFSVEEFYDGPLSPPVRVAHRVETRLYFEHGHVMQQRIGRRVVALNAAQKVALEREVSGLAGLYGMDGADKREER